MKRSILKLIECKSCFSDFNLEIYKEKNDKIQEGMIICPNCQVKYPIKNFIPRFVTNEKYVSSFGEEWNIFHDVKNKDTETSHEELKGYLNLSENDLKDKIVLEIGCGSGPYLEINSKLSQEIIGIDLSLAVEASQKNLGHLENITIMQADLFHLPFKKDIFDVVYSLGVLHHTPNTKDAFFSIKDVVKENGLLSIWLYGAYWNRRDNNQEFIRKYFTSKLNTKQLHFFSNLMSNLYWLYKIPLLGNGLREIIPMGMDSKKEVRALNTFDMYSPTYIHRHKLNEVYQWFKEAGFNNIEPSNWLLGMKGYKKRL